MARSAQNSASQHVLFSSLNTIRDATARLTNVACCTRTDAPYAKRLRLHSSDRIVPMWHPSPSMKLPCAERTSTCGRSEKCRPTSKRAPGSYTSSELMKPKITPDARRKPLLRAWAQPPSGSLIQYANRGAYRWIISTDSSVLPPSIRRYSRFGYPCRSTDRIVSSRYLPWLKLGVTMLMRGQRRSPGGGATARVPAVQGHPSRPDGGDDTGKLAVPGSIIRRSRVRLRQSTPPHTRSADGGLDDATLESRPSRRTPPPRGHRRPALIFRRAA